MNSYSPEVGEFISAVSHVIKKHDHLTEGDVISGLRILSAMMEARITGGRVHVQIVNIQNDDDDDPADAWKFS